MNLQPQPETLNSLNAVSITLDAIAPVIVFIAIFATAAAAFCLFFLWRNETRPGERRRSFTRAPAIYSIAGDRRGYRRKSNTA
ncbi:MAG: hypothetical protein ACKVX9_09340 [Blastocatellia bacterium]